MGQQQGTQSAAPTGKTMNVVVMGNPGAGKSSLLNCLAGGRQFQACNASAGVTHKLDTCSIQYQGMNLTFMDVPGLADAKLRNQARDAIYEALNRKGEQFKILFLITLQAGRIVDQDVATMQMVLASTPDITVQYGVIINKLTPKEMRDYNANGVPQAHMASLVASSDGQVRPEPEVWWTPRIDELEDEENAVVTLPRHMEFIDWIATKVPTCTIVNDVKKIEVEQFEQLKSMLEDQIADLKGNASRLQAALEQANVSRQEEMSRLSSQMAAQRREAEERETRFREDHQREIARQADERREAELREKESRKEERARHEETMRQMREDNLRREREAEKRHAKELEEKQKQKDADDERILKAQGLPLSLVIIEATRQGLNLRGDTLGGDAESPWLYDDLGNGTEITLHDGKRQFWAAVPASVLGGGSMAVQEVQGTTGESAAFGFLNAGVKVAGLNIGLSTISAGILAAGSAAKTEKDRLRIKYGHKTLSIRRRE